MKKYFIKIFTSLLIVAILPVISSFCSFNLLNSITKIDTVKAASANIAIHDKNCDTQNVNQATSMPSNQISIKKNHNFILPCCLNGNDNNVPALNQAVEFNKFIPLIISTTKQLSKIHPNIVFHNTPNISPPELSLIRTTILRL